MTVGLVPLLDAVGLVLVLNRDGVGDGRIAILLPEEGRGIEGVVGALEAHEHVPGIIVLDIADPLDSPVANELVLMMFRGEHGIVGSVYDPTLSHAPDEVLDVRVQETMLVQIRREGPHGFLGGMAGYSGAHAPFDLQRPGETVAEVERPVAVDTSGRPVLGQIVPAHQFDPIAVVAKPPVVVGTLRGRKSLFSVVPVRVGSSPVARAIRAGTQIGEFVQQWVKTLPRAASRLMLGVSTSPGFT